MFVKEAVAKKTPITKEFLENLLKKEIIDFECSVGSNPGDNYTSILFSLEIHLVHAKEPLYLLFKTFPHHPTRQKLLEDTNIFLKEYQVYNIWIPELVKFQKVIGVRNDINQKLLRPAMPEYAAGAAIDYTNENFKWTDLDPMTNNFILMVDVRKTNGFNMANKLKGLGYHHVKVVMDELAKYHSLCYAYKVHKNLPSIRAKFPFFEDSFFCNSTQKPTLDAMSSMNMQMLTDTLESFFEKNPEIKKSFDKLKTPGVVVDYLHLFLNPEGVDEEKVEGLMRRLPNEYLRVPPLEDQWIVAGHGDCWTNNMLFKTDEVTGKVTEAILVDLQLARESCIMADIVYFIYTSTDTKFRKQHLQEMLEWYHQRFLEYSNKSLNISEPFGKGFSNVENFKRKFHRSKLFGFLFASFVLPIILQRPETTLDMDSVEAGEGKDDSENIADMFQKMGRNEDDKLMLRERFTQLLTELYEEGVL